MLFWFSFCHVLLYLFLQFHQLERRRIYIIAASSAFMEYHERRLFDYMTYDERDSFVLYRQSLRILNKHL